MPAPAYQVFAEDMQYPEEPQYFELARENAYARDARKIRTSSGTNGATRRKRKTEVAALAPWPSAQLYK